MSASPRVASPAIAGFCLSEVLIALLILSILSVLAVPAMLEYYARQTAESYIQVFRQELTVARVKAIAQGLDVLICPKNHQQCDARWSGSPIHIMLLSNPPQVLNSMTPLPAGHRLYYNREQLRFRNDGSLNALQNGTFVYCVRNYSWHFQLSVSQAGRSQLSMHSQPCPRL